MTSSKIFYWVKKLEFLTEWSLWILLKWTPWSSEYYYWLIYYLSAYKQAKPYISFHHICYRLYKKKMFTLLTKTSPSLLPDRSGNPNPLPATSLTFRCFCHSQVQANSPSWQIFGTLSFQIFAYAHMQRIKTTAAAAACYRPALHNLTSTYTQQRCLLWRKLQSQLLTPLISQRSYLPLLPQCKYPHENNKSRGKPQWRILFSYHLVHRQEK